MRAYHILLLGFLTIFLGVLCMGLVAEEADAAVITVDDDGGADHTSIRDAVINAIDGDTIYVYEGRYSGNIAINKEITMIGNGSSNTTIDGEGKTNVIRIVSEGMSLSGFTITNGSRGVKIEGDGNHISQTNCSGNDEFGILVVQASQNTLSDNHCSWNQRSGIYLDQSNLNHINNNTCTNNSENGIVLRISDENTLENNSCDRNTEAGILACLDSDNNDILYNLISGNDVGIRVEDESGSNAIHFNTIVDSSSHGIHALDNDGSQVDASRNYWGDPYGPYHPDRNIKSTNDRVTDDVLFIPWVDENYKDMYFDLSLSTSNNYGSADSPEYIYFESTIKNEGNLQENFSLRSLDVSESLTVVFPDGGFSGDLEPGVQKNIKFAVLVEEDSPSEVNYFNITAYSQNDPTLIRTLMFILVVNQTYNVSTNLNFNLLQIFPGYSKTANLTVKNTGNGVDYYKIEISNMDGIIANVEPSLTNNVDPYETITIDVSFSIQGDMEPQTVTFWINVTSQGAEEKAIEVIETSSIDIRIKQAYGVSIDHSEDIHTVSPSHDSSGVKIFSLSVTNEGTGHDIFNFDFRNDTHSQKYKRWITLPNSISLGPGSQTMVNIQIEIDSYETDPDAFADGQLKDVFFFVYSRGADENNMVVEGETTTDFLCHIDIEEYRHALFTSISPETVFLDPEEQGVINVTLKNEGNGIEQYSFIKDGKSGTNQFMHWYDFNETRAVLEPFQSINVTIGVQSDADAEAGIHELEFHAESETTYDTSKESFRIDINEHFGGEFVDGDSSASSPGQSVNMEIMVRNTGNADHQFSLNDPFLPPSWNFTWIGGKIKQISAGSLNPFTLRIMIPSDPQKALAGQYQFQITGQYEDKGGGWTALQGSALMQLRIDTILGVELDTDDYDDAGKPGDLVIYHVEIRNTGNNNDSYQFLSTSAGGYKDARKWVTFGGLDGNDQLTLGPGELRLIDVYAQIPEFDEHDTEAKVGSFGFKVKAKSISNADIEDEIVFELNVKQKYSLDVWTVVWEQSEVLEACCDAELSYTVHVMNLANDIDTITFSIPEGELTGEKGKWDARFGASAIKSVSLDPIQQTAVQLDLTINRTTKPGDYTLKVRGESRGDPSVFEEVDLIIHLSKANYSMVLERTGIENPKTNPVHGDEIEFTFTLLNTGSHEDSFTVDVGNSLNSGTYKGWTIEFETKSMERQHMISVPGDVAGQSRENLEEGRQVEITLYVVVSPDAEAGYYPDILITATSTGDPLQIEVLNFEVTVIRPNIRVNNSVPDFNIDPDTGIEVGDSIDINLRVYNDGNAETDSFYVFFYNGEKNSPNENAGNNYIAFEKIDNIPASGYFDVLVHWNYIEGGDNDIYAIADKPIRSGIGTTKDDNGNFLEDGSVREDREDDNSASIASIFRDSLDLRPDLFVEDVEFKHKNAGKDTEVTVTIGNAGTTTQERGVATVGVKIEGEYLRDANTNLALPAISQELEVGDIHSLHFIWSIPEEAANYTVKISVNCPNDLNPDNNTNILNIETIGLPPDEGDRPVPEEDDVNKTVYVGLGLVIGLFLGVLMIIILLRVASVKAGQYPASGDQSAGGEKRSLLSVISKLIAPGASLSSAPPLKNQEPTPESFAPPAASSLVGESMINTCPSCGTPLNLNSQFCIACGHKIQDEEKKENS